jgi:hypothetical protein
LKEAILLGKRRRKRKKKKNNDSNSKMSEEVWNKVYKSDSTFFGEEPSNFALLCFNYMKANDIKKVLELGAGHGRDTTFLHQY